MSKAKEVEWRDRLWSSIIANSFVDGGESYRILFAQRALSGLAEIIGHLPACRGITARSA